MTRPPEVDRFIAELREFARPTIWRRARGLVVRTWRRTLAVFARKADFGPGLAAGDVLQIGDRQISIAKVEGSTITLADNSTLTL